MGLNFFKTEAKARRKEELEEQHKKETAVPAFYFHNPTHALTDSLQSVPDINKGTDHQRLREAHRQRLEKEAIALAAGSDTHATNIPANYWQAQPLPARFKAPTPASLRKLALSKSSLKGKGIALPETLPAKSQPQKPVDDEGYASDQELKNMFRHAGRPEGLAGGPSRLPVTAQPQRDEAVKSAEAADDAREAELERLRHWVKEDDAREAELDRLRNRVKEDGAREAELERLRNRVKELEAELKANNASRPMNGIQDGTSSSSRWGSQSSAPSCGKDSQKKDDESTPPSTPPSREPNGVFQYDWAMHWLRLALAAFEERGTLHPTVNPPQQLLAQGKDPEARADPQPYDSHDDVPNFSRRISATAGEGASDRPSGSSRRTQGAQTD